MILATIVNTIMRVLIVFGHGEMMGMQRALSSKFVIDAGREEDILLLITDSEKSA